MMIDTEYQDTPVCPALVDGQPVTTPESQENKADGREN